jgi:hypothetical protein
MLDRHIGPHTRFSGVVGPIDIRPPPESAAVGLALQLPLQNGNCNARPETLRSCTDARDSSSQTGVSHARYLALMGLRPSEWRSGKRIMLSLRDSILFFDALISEVPFTRRSVFVDWTVRCIPEDQCSGDDETSGAAAADS